MLTENYIDVLTNFRRRLHERPELSGKEFETAKTVAAFLESCRPDQLVTGLGPWVEPDGTRMGGTGIVASYESGKDGPTLLFRCELDGLPIEEINPIPHISQIPMKSHLCGHDGHMAILLGLAHMLHLERPATGRVVLLFQPAEETGKGAKAILQDPGFAPFKPDFSFALHNLPGLELGSVWLKQGAMCCASRGIAFRFAGKTSHASMPQDGISPDDALCSLMAGLKELSNGLDAGRELDDEFRLVTITHLQMGEPAFGVAPAVGELWATLRTVTDEAMADLVTNAEDLAKKLARQHNLQLSMRQDDVFDACTNGSESTRMVEKALEEEAIRWEVQPEPMRFSEDFGQFGQQGPATLFLLGSGTDQPQLHNPDFDFPDELIKPATSLFDRIIRQQLG